MTAVESVRQQFIADIIANPADDAVRLIFADWLDEQDTPPSRDLAEFIRAQCVLQKFRYAEEVREGRYDARDSVDADWAAALHLHDKEMRLLWRDDNWEAWCYAEARNEDGTPARASGRGGCAAVRRRPGLGKNSCGCSVDTDAGLIHQTFRRGFLAKVRCPLAVWEEHGPLLVARHPVEQVELTDAETITYCAPVKVEGRSWTLNAEDCRWLEKWLIDQWGLDMMTPWWFFDTEDEAKAALSREALAWARRAATTVSKAG